MSIMDDDTIACAERVRRSDPERFRAVMAAPPPARQRLFPLYAFNVEVARAPWITREPMIAEMRLQWWRDALSEIREGRPVRRHEVTTPLARVVAPETAELLDQLVVERRWDIYRQPFDDSDHLRRYLDRTAGHLLLAAARALAPAPESPLRAAGRALGLANFLCAVPALRRAGRHPLPDDSASAIAELAREGLASLAHARARRAEIPPRARPALYALYQTGAILRAARSEPARVGEGRLAPAPALARLSLIARAATGRW